LKRRDRKVYRTGEAPQDLVEAILTARPPRGTRRFDDEVGAADELQRLQALRDAAQCGIADIEAGRFVQFESRKDLRRHLAAVTHEAVRKGRSGRRLK
jgi:predicted transcriptional regulator